MSVIASKTVNSVHANGVTSDVPLVVDLDGTLIHSDLLFESTFVKLGRKPFEMSVFLHAFAGGKAALKSFFAADFDLDPALLSYDSAVLALIQTAKSAGRPIYLASGSNERLVRLVADHLRLFDGWLASTNFENLTGKSKAERLVDTFGERGFDYVGNDPADLDVWAHANVCYGVRLSASVRGRLATITADYVQLETDKPDFRQWIKLLRVHQYAKNLLVFIPALTAHKFSYDALLIGFLAFAAFSLCASSVYIINDLVDLQADRKHPTKRLRPLANGSLPQRSAILFAAALFAAAAATAYWVSLPFEGVILSYFLLTAAYTFSLKRKMIVDVVTLSLLYCARVGGGAVAELVPISEWLLAFSMFMFTTLAMIKRHVELARCLDRGLPDPFNRNYKVGDIDVIAAMAAAAGFNAITVFTFYISSDAVEQLYRRPLILWAICPLLMYWIGRVILMAHRRLVDDDPILFALRDRPSWMTLGLVGLLLLVAM